MSLWGDDAPLGKWAQRKQDDGGPAATDEEPRAPGGPDDSAGPAPAGESGPAGPADGSSRPAPRRSTARKRAIAPRRATAPDRAASDRPAQGPAAPGRATTPDRAGRDCAEPDRAASSGPELAAVGPELPAQPPRPGSREAPLSVSAVVRAAVRTLDQALGAVWVEGESSSVSYATSGHVYFTLKDADAQLRIVIFRADARRLRFRIEDGQRLRCYGRPRIFQRDGKFQFYVTHAEPAGLGAEALALEQLKRALAAEGLFARDRKRPLPMLPRRIGVVTSRSGAAVQDIIRTVQSRFPVPILVADTAVQGVAAPRQIVRALRAIACADVDVVIVGRGGGSASDLSAFNDEAVVRAVAACPVPTISAVGHEVDTSLTDLAADCAASTPTRAAELAVPVLADLEQRLRKEEQRLLRELRFRLNNARQELDQLLADASGCLALAGGKRRRDLIELEGQLAALRPQAVLERHRASLAGLQGRMHAWMQRRLDGAGERFAGLSARLDSLSPLRVLSRGYSLTTTQAPDGTHVVTSVAQVAVGDAVSVRLARGALDCRVEGTHDEVTDGSHE